MILIFTLKSFLIFIHYNVSLDRENFGDRKILKHFLRSLGEFEQIKLNISIIILLCSLFEQGRELLQVLRLQEIDVLSDFSQFRF